MRTTCLLVGLLMLIAGCRGSSSDQEPTRSPEQPEVGGGSPPQPEPLPPADEPGLKRFASGAELAAFLTELNAAGTTGLRGPSGTTDLVSPAALSAAAGEFSTTTIQEIGVDESDMVKTDGTYFYILKDGEGSFLQTSEIRIVKAQPPEMMQQVSSVKIDGFGTALYLHDDVLIALSHKTGSSVRPAPLPSTNDVIAPMSVASSVAVPQSGRTIVTIIDVSNSAAPQIERTIALDGVLSHSRLIGGSLHLILSEFLPPSTGPIPANQLDDILPTFVAAGSGGATKAGLIAEPTAFYRPVDFSDRRDSIPASSLFPFGVSFTTVASIDLDDSRAPIEAISVFARSGTLYASRAALYLASTLCRGCTAFLSPVNSTEVHKIALTEKGPVYTASGIIPGGPLDQYSFSEHNGFLRVATTSPPPVPPAGVTSAGPSNNVFVLRESATRLEIVGRIEDIARGERIMSARFVGDRGFLVTFRLVDPLFTLNQST